MVVDEDDEVLLINSNGVIIRIKAGDVSQLGRATQGVRIMKVDKDTDIISMAKVLKEDEEEDGETREETEEKDNDQIEMKSTEK